MSTHSSCCTDGLAITVHDGNVAYMMNWHLMKQHSRISHDVNRRTRSRSASSFTLTLLHTSAVELPFKNVALKKPFKTSKAQFRSFRFLFLLCNLINKPHIQIWIVICEICQFRRHLSHGVLACTLFTQSHICFWIVLSYSVFVQKNLKTWKNPKTSA